MGESTIYSIFSPTQARRVKKSSIDSLTQHLPQENMDIAILDFRELKQGSNESLNEFYADCNFHNEEAEVKTKIIHKSRDPRLR